MRRAYRHRQLVMTYWYDTSPKSGSLFRIAYRTGLMFRSFRQLQRIDPAFDPRGLLTFQVLGNRGGQKPEDRAAFVRQILQHLQAIPGVRSVTAAFPFALAGGFSPIRG